MATETFDKTIWIDEKAAQIIIDELEKPPVPYVPMFDEKEVERSTREWLERYRSKKSSKPEENTKSFVKFYQDNGFVFLQTSGKYLQMIRHL